MSHRSQRRLDKKKRGKAQRARAAGKARAARCPILTACGACTHQHIPYARQLADKRAHLLEALGDLVETDRVGKVQGLETPFGFRTRLTMPAAPARPPSQRPFHVGFYRSGTTRLVAAETCPVQHPLALSVLTEVLDLLGAAKIAATAPKSKKGWLHGIGVRVDPTLESAEVTLSARTRDLPGGQELAEKIVAISEVSGLHLSVNPSRSSYLHEGEMLHLAGSPTMPFHLAGHTFALSPGSFFQTSAEGAELLAATVLDMLPERFDKLADLYGGVGVFARLTEDRWQQATVVETNKRAVADLRAFVADTATSSLSVVHQPVEEAIEEVLRGQPDVVILDPPRKGCHPKVIDALVADGPATVLYVACGLSAFVSDATKLTAGGYTIDRLESVDMFPHTAHTELIARLTRGERPTDETPAQGANPPDGPSLDRPQT